MALKAPGDLCACRPWPVEPCCCDGWPDTWDEIKNGVPYGRELTPDEVQALWAQQVASSRLHILTAYRWGLCEDLVRPCGPRVCRQPVGCGPSAFGGVPAGYPLAPYLSNGQMYNCGCGCSSCEIGCTIVLPGPVNEVLSVTVDGAELAPEVDWFVNGEGALVKTDGCWPHSQDMRAACGEEGSFCVRYLRGINPAADADAIRAVSHLACALYTQACGGKCPSLKNATRITRGDVEYEKVPGARDTGVEPADEWLDLVNPRRIMQVPYVRSLDRPRWVFRGVSEFQRARGSTS
jgi:hypothetical protein